MDSKNRTADASDMESIPANGSDTLHPWRVITGAVGGGRVVGAAKRLVSRTLYEYLGRRYPTDEWTTMNYGYAPIDTSAAAMADGASEQLALNLYGHLASLGAGTDALTDAEVLEIGSGRGGGAAHIASELPIRFMTALDVSSSATALAARRHGAVQCLRYVQGDAEDLDFADNTFDIVINVESAHCYGSMARFLREVHRVLKPGGELRFADFASRRGAADRRLEEALSNSPLDCVLVEDITANVVRALELDEARKRALLARWVKGPFATFARGAYAMEGSAMRRELSLGQTRYLAAVLSKPVVTTAS